MYFKPIESFEIVNKDNNGNIIGPNIEVTTDNIFYLSGNFYKELINNSVTTVNLIGTNNFLNLSDITMEVVNTCFERYCPKELKYLIALIIEYKCKTYFSTKDIDNEIYIYGNGRKLDVFNLPKKHKLAINSLTDEQYHDILIKYHLFYSYSYVRTTHIGDNTLTNYVYSLNDIADFALN
jgi:hypothetical protein